jgi:hypothetical protein
MTALLTAGNVAAMRMYRKNTPLDVRGEPRRLLSPGQDIIVARHQAVKPSEGA